MFGAFFFSVQLRVVFYQGRCHQDSSFNLSLRQSVNIFLLICRNQFTLVQHFAFQFSFAHRNVYRRFLFDNFQLSQLPFCIQLTNMYSWVCLCLPVIISPHNEKRYLLFQSAENLPSTSTALHCDGWKP